MSVSAEVRRTLVKSPPELWAELSDPESLTRHLGELGEIRIKRAEPETVLEWEADGASGTVQLEPSGFGTKVTLSLEREIPAPEARTDAVEAVEADAVAEPEPKHDVPEATADVEPETDLEPEAAAEETEPHAMVEPEPKLGLFARLFRRRRKEPVVAVEPEPEPEPVVAVEPEPKPEPVAVVEPEPQPEPAGAVVAELEAIEAQMAEQTADLLTSVLDRLGAAHHRPFSRG